MSNVAPADHPMYNFAKPERVGPGEWWTMMLVSAKAKDNHDIMSACGLIRLICDNLGCLKCRGHAAEYVTSNPPELSSGTARELFNWVVTFMNAVNTRLGKQTYDVDILWKSFTDKDSGVCTSNCGGTPVPPKPTVVTNRGNKSFVLVRHGVRGTR